MAIRTQNRIERLQPESLRGQYFFQGLLQRAVLFEDTSDYSDNYLKLSYDPSRTFSGGRNLISIRGNFDTMEVNSEILIEAVDANGNLISTQVYDLNDDAHNRVIATKNYLDHYHSTAIQHLVIHYLHQ